MAALAARRGGKKEQGEVMPRPTTRTRSCFLAMHASALATGESLKSAPHIVMPASGSGSAKLGGVMYFERQCGPPPPKELMKSSGKTTICAPCAAALPAHSSAVLTFIIMRATAPAAVPSQLLYGAG